MSDDKGFSVVELKEALTARHSRRESAKTLPDDAQDTYDLAHWPDATPDQPEHNPHKHHHGAPDRFSLPMSAH